jgi:heat shock protein HtpX
VTIPSAVAFLLALAPALVSYWTGRAILARVDDPALPELLLGRQRRMSRIVLGGAIALGVLAGPSLFWSLPLLWVALLVAGYPIRRGLFAERWSLLAFLRYAIFSGLGKSGWQLLAALGPLVVIGVALGTDPEAPRDALRLALWIGSYFAAVAIVWQHFYTRVWLDLHRATPLRASARPELLSRLDAVLDRASLRRRPEIYRFGAAGGHFVNAFAIPSLTHPAIALSDGLLATLTDDEIVGVFAHEVAHHEQFTRRRLWGGRVAGILLALLNVALPAALILLGPLFTALGALVYYGAIIATLGRSAGKRRLRETESDLRAAALTGNPEAVASALTKVHLSNRVPRRWPHAMESAATHPSLARRIQALRAVAPVNLTAAPRALAVVRSARGNTVVVLESSRAHWFENVPSDSATDLDALRAAASSYRAVAYGDLTELRIGAAGSERTLIAIDRRGHAWAVPVAAADVARLQAVLDTVDVRLGHRPPALQPVGIATARLLAIAALIALTVSGEAGVVLVPVLFILFRPALTAALAAAGAITLGRALVAAMGLAWFDLSAQMGVVGALAAGVALVVITVMRVRVESRRDAVRRPPREAWLMLLLLACIAALMLLQVVPATVARPASVLGSPYAISAATTLAGIAAALATFPGRWRRIGGGLTSFAALTAGTVLAGNGVLYNRSAAIVWSNGALTAAGSVGVPGGSAMRLAVSPGAESYAIAQYRSARRVGISGMQYLIGRFGAGAPRSSDALQVAFLDDSTVVTVALLGTDSLELRAESIAADSSGSARLAWRESIPAVTTPELSLDRAHHAWIVFGRDEGDRAILVSTDSIGGRHPRTYRWLSPSSDESGELSSHPIVAFTDGTAIALALSGVGEPGSTVASTLLLMGGPRWQLRSVSSAHDETLADIDGIPICGSEIDAHGALCAERTPSRTHVWRIGATHAARVGDLPPSLNLIHPLGGGRVTAVERFGGRLAIVDVDAGRAMRLTLPSEDPRGGASAHWTSDVIAAGNFVVVLSSTRAASVVRRYRIR